jgi:hypothetical protein
MNMLKVKTYVLLTMMIASGALCVYSVYLSDEGLVAGSALYQSWGIIYSILVAIWTIDDMKTRGEQPTFGHGLAALILWPLFLLWHLVKSRGTEGIVVYLGFLALYSLANVLNMAFYFVL